MANEKKYFEFLDIPDGNGSTERWHTKDAEAQAGIAQVASAIGLDDFVDLGLPSGTLWAKCNIGAASETAVGNFYMYGKGATQYSSGASAYTGMENPLDPSKDTATQVLGKHCHMPTQAQIEELIANTTCARAYNYKSSGVNGWKLTANNGNVLFFPDTGYYNTQGTKQSGEAASILSSTPEQMSEPEYDNLVVELSIYSTSPSVVYTPRTFGHTVRAVVSKTVFGLIDEKADNKTMTGATSSAAGAKGLVPAPAAGDNVKFLRGDGTWADDLPRASFVGTTLVFSSGGTFSGTTLLLS